MNKIDCILDNSDYEGFEEFMNLRVDGLWLDEKLDQLYPEKGYKGLIPTLVSWMERKDEKQVVWNRILPKENQVAICPVLMCPDEPNFSCTVIVAEIYNFGAFVQWRRIGVNQNLEWEAESVGTKVYWLERFPELNFEMKDYLSMLDKFKQNLNLSKFG